MKLEDKIGFCPEYCHVCGKMFNSYIPQSHIAITDCEKKYVRIYLDNLEKEYNEELKKIADSLLGSPFVQQVKNGQTKTRKAKRIRTRTNKVSKKRTSKSRSRN